MYCHLRDDQSLATSQLRPTGFAGSVLGRIADFGSAHGMLDASINCPRGQVLQITLSPLKRTLSIEPHLEFCSRHEQF